MTSPGGRMTRDDAVLRALARDGIPVDEVRAFDDPHSPFVEGYRITIEGAEIVFRVLDRETVVIVLYRRTAMHATLRTAFTGLIRFADRLRSRDLGVKRLVGVVDTSSYRPEGGLSDDRLERFYRLMGARRISPGEVPGLTPLALPWYTARRTVWVALELDDFRPPRAYRRGREEPTTTRSRPPRDITDAD